MVDNTIDINKDYNENESVKDTNVDNNNTNKIDEGQSISGMVNQETVKQLIEMGYSKNVAEKALFLNQQILEKSIEWIYENQNEPDFEEELRIMGQENKKILSPEEIQQKAMELSKIAHEKFLKKEKERAEEQELNRIRMSKYI